MHVFSIIVEQTEENKISIRRTVIRSKIINIVRAVNQTKPTFFLSRYAYPANIQIADKVIYCFAMSCSFLSNYMGCLKTHTTPLIRSHFGRKRLVSADKLQYVLWYVCK